MSKRTFISFGIFVLVLAVAIPFFVFRERGDADNGPEKVSQNLESGQMLFEINCGTCHALYAAGTDGNYGPDLDELLAPSGVPTGDEVKGVRDRVLNAIDQGVDSTTTSGRMPPEIISGPQAEEVAEFVANTAGED